MKAELILCSFLCLSPISALSWADPDPATAKKTPKISKGNLKIKKGPQAPLKDKKAEINSENCKAANLDSIGFFNNDEMQNCMEDKSSNKTKTKKTQK